LPSIFNKENKIDLHQLLNFEKLWSKAFEKKFEQKKIINFFKKQFGTIFKFRKFKDYYPNLLNSYKIKQIESGCINYDNIYIYTYQFTKDIELYHLDKDFNIFKKII
jgi:hypothetical protein